MSPALASLVSSAALGEALLFLATNSAIELTDRRVFLVRELSRVEVRRALGLHASGSEVPRRLRGGEPLPIVEELRRAAAYGTTSAMHRYRVGGAIAEVGVGTAGATRPAA
jgi:hypothetical protein